MRIPTCVPVADLLHHMGRHYFDYHIERDLDAVLLACQDEEAVRVVEAYALARRRAPGFDSRAYEGSRRHNSHDATMLVTLLEERANARCDNCEAPFRASRSTARYCSGRCRQQARRGSVSR